MFEVSPDAAKQIQDSAREGNLLGMALRVAVQKDEAGQLHYAMGFDDNITDEDEVIEIENVNIVISILSKDLLKGTKLDFVEVEKNVKEFIFINPNDPNCSVSS